MSGGDLSVPSAEVQGRLFIAGLSPLITCEQVNNAFGRYGEHLGVVLRESNHLPYLCKVGNVTFKRAVDAAAALSNLNGAVVFDIPVQVTWANGQLEALTGWQTAQLAPQQQLQHPNGPSASISSGSSMPQVGTANFSATGGATLPEIFVADFPTTFDEAGLMNIFAAFPSVRSARIMRDKTSGKCRGYGFVAFADVPSAQRAIATMHGEIVCGKALRVGRAEVKPPGATAAASTRSTTRSMGLPPTAGAASGPLLSYETIRLSSDITNTTVYFGELPHTVSEDKLTLLVAEFGRVIQIRIQRPPPTPDGVHPKPFAFVKLDTHEGASKAIHAAGGRRMDGQIIKSGWSKDKVSPDPSPRRSGATSSAVARTSPAQPQTRSQPQVSHPAQPSSQVQAYLPQSHLMSYQLPPQSAPQHYPMQQPQQHQYIPVAAFNASPVAAYGAASVPFNGNYPNPLPGPMVPAGFAPAFRTEAMPPHAAPAVPVPVPPHMQMQPNFRFP